jgi:hypothetical protein
MVLVSGGRWCRGNTHTNELWNEDVGRMDVRELPLGQLLARTRWDTHASGLAFDRKKTSLLAEQAQAFIAEQSLCVIAGPGPQAELLPSPSSVLPGLFVYRRPLPLLGLHVRQAFFHCPKYIKMRIPGLTAAVASPSEETWPLRRLVDRSQGYLSEPMRAYIAQLALYFWTSACLRGKGIAS